MGLIELFGKKQKELVKWKATVNKGSDYDPWDKRKGNSNTDFSTAVFLSMRSHKATAIHDNANSYPRYVSYELSISDPVKKHKELLKNGFLRKATVSETLDTFRVVELKAILESHGLPAKGKRTDLIASILASCNEKELKLPLLYVVSETGLAFMDQHKDLIKLHGNPYSISYEEYMDAKSKASPYLTHNDIIWFIFGQREFNPVFSKRNNELHRAMFLMSENRMADALYHYIVVLFYDIHNPNFDTIAPDIRERIFELKEYYTEEMVSKCYRNRDIQGGKVPQEAFKLMLTGIFQQKETM